jgi:hypothetical protein
MAVDISSTLEQRSLPSFRISYLPSLLGTERVTAVLSIRFYRARCVPEDPAGLRGRMGVVVELKCVREERDCVLGRTHNHSRMPSHGVSAKPHGVGLEALHPVSVVLRMPPERTGPSTVIY